MIAAKNEVLRNDQGNDVREDSGKEIRNCVRESNYKFKKFS